MKTEDGRRKFCPLLTLGFVFIVIFYLFISNLLFVLRRINLYFQSTACVRLLLALLVVPGLKPGVIYVEPFGVLHLFNQLFAVWRMVLLFFKQRK